MMNSNVENIQLFKKYPEFSESLKNLSNFYSVLKRLNRLDKLDKLQSCVFRKTLSQIDSELGYLKLVCSRVCESEHVYSLKDDIDGKDNKSL